MDDMFKYFPINEFLLSTLKDNEIWFSNPNNFNDPFDCNLKCNYLKDFDFEKCTNDMLREDFNSATSNEEYLRKHQIQTRIAIVHEHKRKTETKQINEDLQNMVMETGVSCFSKNNSSILMWSHYSDNHKGVCLKFNTSDKAFFENYHSVKYVEKFPSTNEIFDTNSSHNFLFFTKSEEWNYEQEVRLIKNSNSLVKFNPNCLEAIYFGAKCGNKDVEEIINLVDSQNKYKNVSYYKMKLAPENFKLVRELINN